MRLRRFTLAAAKAITYTSEGLHLRECKPSQPHVSAIDEKRSRSSSYSVIFSFLAVSEVLHLYDASPSATHG